MPELVTPESRPFWDGLRAGKLMLPACRSCGPFFYPRAFCPRCHSREIKWVQSTGKGRLHAFEILYQTFNPGFQVPLPCILAMVELDEGPRLMSNLVGIDPDPNAIRCDMRIKVVFERIQNDFVLPLFRPDAEP